MVSEFQLLIR